MENQIDKTESSIEATNQTQATTDTTEPAENPKYITLSFRELLRSDANGNPHFAESLNDWFRRGYRFMARIHEPLMGYDFFLFERVE